MTPNPATEPVLAHRLRVALGRLLRTLRSMEAEGLSWSQAALLGRLECDGEATAAALAAAEGVRPQSMAAALDVLEREGLVARRPDTQDRRQLLVSITERGRAMILSARASREQWLAQAMTKRFSQEEMATVSAAVCLIERLAEEER